MVVPSENFASSIPAGQMVRGKVLDQESGKPLVGEIIVCEADTLCRTRTATDGSFALLVPTRIANSKLIAALAEKPGLHPADEEAMMPYVPRYFTGGTNITVLLRRPSMVLGQTRLKPGETYTPAILRYLVHNTAIPPPAKLIKIKFMPAA